jgi:hypothetical protein
MSSEAQLRDKLRKIEALYAGAGTAGEKFAAEAALDRVRARLAESVKRDVAIETQLSLGDQWSRTLFVALCRRYGLKPYRLYRQRHTTVMLKVPTPFVNQVLWPEFEELDKALRHYLHDITTRIIRDEVHKDTSEAAEMESPRSLPGA